MESKNLKDLREKRKQWFSQMEHSLLGPGPETKSQGTGLKNIVTIARNAGIKASLDIRRVVPLFYLTEALGFAAFTKRSD